MIWYVAMFAAGWMACIMLTGVIPRLRASMLSALIAGSFRHHLPDAALMDELLSVAVDPHDRAGCLCPPARAALRECIASLGASGHRPARGGLTTIWGARK